MKYFRRLDDVIHLSTGAGIIASYGNTACKIHNFCEHVCFLMSSWVVLCMSVERFVAVNFPFKKDLLCKPRNATTVILVVFAMLSYSQIFRLIIIEKSDADAVCIAPAHYLHIYVIMHVYMYQLALQFSLPSLLTLVCNMSILWKIWRLRLMVAKHGTQHSARARANRHKTTCMLLLVSFTYIFTLLPLVLLSVVMHIAVRTDPPLARRIYSDAGNARLLLELVAEVNYGVNFYIYALSGSRFRSELHTMLFRKHSFMSSGGPTEKLQVFNFRKSASVV